MTVPVLNLERSIAFYQILGLQLIVKSLPHYARFVCEAGNATLSCIRWNNSRAERAFGFIFENENLDETVSELQSKGLIFEAMPADPALAMAGSAFERPG